METIQERFVTATGKRGGHYCVWDRATSNVVATRSRQGDAKDTAADLNKRWRAGEDWPKP